MRVTVSGLPGSGTTSLTYYIADMVGYKVISAGEVFRDLAKERSMTLAEFGAYCEGDASIDRMIDECQHRKVLERDDIIAEGRLSGFMIPEADLKIWLKASSKCRVSRILDRDQFSDIAAAHQATLDREASEAHRYCQYYEIDINSMDPYHLVLDTELFSVEQLGKIVSSAIFSLDI